MRIKWDGALKKSLAVGAICFVLAGQYVLAQNLGATPQFNQAVQGQTGSQPEGAFLNFINWIGNVLHPWAPVARCWGPFSDGSQAGATAAGC